MNQVQDQHLRSEGCRVGQKKLSCAAKASVDPRWSSRLGEALQRCPHQGKSTEHQGGEWSPMKQSPEVCSVLSGASTQKLGEFVLHS